MGGKYPVGDPVGDQVNRAVIGHIDHLPGDLSFFVEDQGPVDTGHRFYMSRYYPHIMGDGHDGYLSVQFSQKVK
jgi:hypothetical protein